MSVRTLWWLVTCLVLNGLQAALLNAEEHIEGQPSLPEPSAAALERSTAHAAANPQTLDTWVWLTKATNAVLGHRRWGHVLDAGTGPGSMSWLCAQPTESVIAVTAARNMANRMKTKLKKPCKPVELLRNVPPPPGSPNVLLVGNWFTEQNGKPPLTQHPMYTARKFDIVLAEYLLGALEHFAAFNEQKMMDLIASSVRVGGLLLFCGRTPFDYPGPEAYKNYSRAEQLVLDTERIRDAAMLLSQQREYREFPAWWVAGALKQRGLEIMKQKAFVNKVGIDYVTTQLEWAMREAKKVSAPSFKRDLLKHIESLQVNANAQVELISTGIAFGGSYCFIARNPPNASTPQLGKCAAAP
eukprot:COSAG02_NODE_1510_length_12225_cov_3.918770_7_plen_356_part_00